MVDSPILRCVSLEHVLITLALFGLSCTAWTAVYRLYLQPLAKYPGPVAAKLTYFYMTSAGIQCKSTYLRHEIHQRYGHVVRVGPNKIFFCDAACIMEIYDGDFDVTLEAAFKSDS